MLKSLFLGTTQTEYYTSLAASLGFVSIVSLACVGLIGLFFLVATFGRGGR